jgi:hypothetical protein
MRAWLRHVSTACLREYSQAVILWTKVRDGLWDSAAWLGTW